jgi:glycosyltransferase involved in cell wall biosynthesis
MLTQLLAELNRQYQPGLGVIIARDNCDMQYGDKCQKILDASEADYVSFLDDDDWIAEDFVSAIMEALEQRPDYVGFQVDYTEDGRKMMPVYHTLKYRGWVDNPEALYRDIVHFNPIKRELANHGKWGGGCGADRHWADQVRDSGLVKTEVYIDRELHHYRKVGRSFSVPERMIEVPPRPNGYTFVRWLEI